MEMTNITTDITTLSQSFDTIVSALANYTADDTKQKGSNSKALEGIIKSFSLLQTTLTTPENGVTRLNNIKNFFGDSGFVSTLSNISTDKGTLDNFKTNVTNICETFGGGDVSLGKQLELLSAPLASLKKGITNLPSFEVSEGGDSLAETFEKRFNSISQLVNSLNGIEINDVEFKIPDISKLFNSIIETTVKTEDITKTDWEEISKEEYDILQGGETILNAYGDVATKTDKFFKQVEKKIGTKNITTYSSKLNTFTTNLLEMTKVLNPFKSALSTFVKTDLSPTYKGADIKATENIYKVDDKGNPTSEILYKKGDVIASAVPQPITKELIGQRISAINSLIEIGNEFQSMNIGSNYTDMTKLQVKLYDFIQENVIGTGKTPADKINSSDGLPLIALLLGDVVKPFNTYRAGLVGFVNGITSATSDEYETNEEITKYVSVITEEGHGKTVAQKTKKKGKLSQDIPGLTEKISTFLNLINVGTIASWMTPITKLKTIGTTFNNITGKYTDNKNKTRYVVVDNIDSVVNSMSEVMKAIRKLPNKVEDDANDKNIQKKMQSISNVVHAFAKEALVFNTMTELDTLPYMIESLHLNDKAVVVGGEYEDDDGHIIDEKKYKSLKPEQQSKYTFRAKTKDLSITHSIQTMSGFMTDIVKSIEKVSSVPIWSVTLAPIKMKIISSSIRKSVRSMIDAVMEINNMDETKEERLMKALGWVPENNKYLIAEDGTFVTREEIETDDDGKQTKKLVNVENANYKKGHFAAEDGLFKIGDYISTLIGCITKVAEINPIKMQIASLKVRFCIKGIIKTIGEMSRSIIDEMSSLATDGTSAKIKKLMGSSEKRIEQVVEGNYSITDTTEKKEPGVFDTIITFFTIYDNVMKIADNGFIKTILRMQKAGINIRIMLHGLKSINKNIENFSDSVAKIQSKDKKSDPIKTLCTTIDSLSKVVTSVTAMGALSIFGLLMIIPLKLFLKAIVGGDNKNKNGENGRDNSIIGLLFRIKDKWESLEGDSKGKGKGGSFTMTILTMTGSFMLLIGAMVLVKQNVKSAFVGLISLTMLLASIIGILWVVSKLNKGGEQKPENGTVGKSARTLLLISGALLGFAISLGILAVFVTKYNGEIWRGILQVSSLIAVSIGMLYLISLLKKPIDNGAKQLLFIGGTFLLFTLVLGLMTKIIQENESQMWNAILQLGLIVGIAVGTLFLLSLLKKDVTQGVIMMLLISGAFLIFGITMNLMFNAVKDASWGDFGMIAATLVLMIGAVMAIGAIMSVPLVGQIALGMILSGVGIMLAVSSGFLVFANTLIKINEVFENNSPQQVEKNLESMLVCLDKMTAKLSDMPDISRQQKKSMRRLASITDSIGSMANVLRDIADFRIANIDEKTGKIIGYRYITENDFARAGDNTKMIVQKMIELGKILADDDNGISRKDARKAKRQGKRLGRLASLTEPIQSTIELIETIAGGQITYMKNGKEVTQDITAFFNENGENVKTSLQTFITGVNDIFSGINTTNGAYVNEYQSNMITTRMTAMSDMLDSMTAVADNGTTKNLTTVSNNTERMVNSINALNTDKVKQFRNVLEDLQDFNDELSDIFEKLEETMSTLVDEIKSVNGMESKSSGTKQTTSSSTTTVHTTSSPNLTNIESDVDDLLNELRSIKALMQR